MPSAATAAKHIVDLKELENEESISLAIAHNQTPPGKKPRRIRPLTIWICAAGLCCAVIIFAALLTLGIRSRVAPEVSVAAAKPNWSGPAPVLISEYMEAYELDSVAARKEYEGKIALVKGVVEGTGDYGDLAIVDLIADDTRISCYFNPPYRKQIATLSVGQETTIKGRMGPEGGYLDLHDCILESPHRK